MVATAGVKPLLFTTKDAISPVPLAANPIEVVLLTQLKTILLPPLPLLGLVKFIRVVASPLHNVWSLTTSTVAVGLTVMVNVLEVPTQLTPPLVKVGVTVIVAITGVVVVLLATKVGIFPVPLAAIPIDGALFTQL